MEALLHALTVACELPARVHPYSQSLIAALYSGDLLPEAFLIGFGLPQSELIEPAVCVVREFAGALLI